jgi:hypothetical protein
MDDDDRPGRADDVVNGSIKANSPRGEHAKPEVSYETARLPKPGSAHHAASAPEDDSECGSCERNPQQ